MCEQPLSCHAVSECAIGRKNNMGFILRRRRYWEAHYIALTGFMSTWIFPPYRTFLSCQFSFFITFDHRTRFIPDQRNLLILFRYYLGQLGTFYYSDENTVPTPLASAYMQISLYHMQNNLQNLQPNSYEFTTNLFIGLTLNLYVRT